MGAEDWAAVAAVAAVVSAVGVILAWRATRRANPRVSWTAQASKVSHGTELVLTNVGTSTARRVRVSLEPPPKSPRSELPAEQDVARNGQIRVSWTNLAFEEGPKTVSVAWGWAWWRSPWRSPI